MTEVKPTALMSTGGKVTIALPKDFMRQTKPIQCRTIKLNNSTITVKTSLLKQLVTGTPIHALPSSSSSFPSASSSAALSSASSSSSSSSTSSTGATTTTTYTSSTLPTVTSVKKIVMTSSALPNISTTATASVARPPSGPTQNEMMNAIEELRRENERILTELGATQDLLDLFENYRKLMRDHLDVCICAGRDHNISQWRRLEREYRRLSALQRPEPGEIVNGVASSVYNKNSTSLRAAALSNKAYTKSNHHLMNGHGPGSPMDIDDYSMQPSGQGKSLVMSYLDRIAPVRMDSPSQEPSPKVDITPDGNTFWIRKRPGPDGQLPQPVIAAAKKPKIVRNDRQEVERLDKLNNALDQILMGRFDALNQLRDDGEEDDDDMMEEEEEEERRIVVNGAHSAHSALGAHRGASEDGDAEDYDDDDDDVVLVDEVKATNRNNNNNNQTGGSSRTILSAALQSGFKPYPNYNHMTASTSNASPNKSLLSTNSSSIRIYTPQQQHQFQQQQTQSGSLLQPNNDMRFNMYQKRPHLTSEERLDIINRLKKNESGARIARDYGITKQAVSAIKRRAQLMGDQFKLQEHKVYLMQGTGRGSGANSPAPSGKPSGTGKPTMVTINVAANAHGGATMVPMDSSLVSRQLKQQRVPPVGVAIPPRQTPFVANFTRSASNLCLPVNPVAILKSQMASKQTAEPSPGQISNTNNTTPTTNAKIDSKRLILPRLLQGTEAYEPIYGQLVKKFNLRPQNDNNDNEEEEEKSSSDEEKPVKMEALRDEQSEESDGTSSGGQNHQTNNATLVSSSESSAQPDLQARQSLSSELASMLIKQEHVSDDEGDEEEVDEEQAKETVSQQDFTEEADEEEEEEEEEEEGQREEQNEISGDEQLQATQEMFEEGVDEEEDEDDEEEDEESVDRNNNQSSLLVVNDDVEDDDEEAEASDSKEAHDDDEDDQEVPEVD